MGHQRKYLKCIFLRTVKLSSIIWTTRDNLLTNAIWCELYEISSCNTFYVVNGDAWCESPLECLWVLNKHLWLPQLLAKPPQPLQAGRYGTQAARVKSISFFDTCIVVMYWLDFFFLYFKGMRIDNITLKDNLNHTSHKKAAVVVRSVVGARSVLLRNI